MYDTVYSTSGTTAIPNLLLAVVVSSSEDANELSDAEDDALDRPLFLNGIMMSMVYQAMACRF